MRMSRRGDIRVRKKACILFNNPGTTMVFFFMCPRYAASATIPTSMPKNLNNKDFSIPAAFANSVTVGPGQRAVIVTPEPRVSYDRASEKLRT